MPYAAKETCGVGHLSIRKLLRIVSFYGTIHLSYAM